MRYFDLHCDTLTACMEHAAPLMENDAHVSLKKGAAYVPYVQCMAVFVPDTLRGDTARAYVDRHADYLEHEAARHGFKIFDGAPDGSGVLLTVEGGAALAGRLQNVQHLRTRGVRMMTLTWNGSNEIGSGVLSKDTFGLTPFGRDVVREMERVSMVVDVSHASERLFYDVAACAEKPFVASHSNAKACCAHPRNLTDAQFEILRKKGGLVGLNFYRNFLNAVPDAASMEDVYRHAEHFLALSGEDTLAVGSDFDGAELPSDMRGLESVEALREIFLRHNVPEALVDKIFFQNAARFFSCTGL